MVASRDGLAVRLRSRRIELIKPGVYGESIARRNHFAATVR